MRMAFNRLVDGLARKPEPSMATGADRATALRLEWKQRLQTALGLNSRYADDAILKANEVSASQRKRIPVEIAETEAKRQRTERKRKANLRKVERLEAAGRADEAETARRAIAGQELRLAKLDAKLAEYRRHQAERTIPRVVFGGRRLWRRLCRSVGPEHTRLRAEWQAARRGRLYSRGDAAKGGNPNLRIGLGADGGFTLAAANQ